VGSNFDTQVKILVVGNCYVGTELLCWYIVYAQTEVGLGNSGADHARHTWESRVAMETCNIMYLAITE
jgi:hypothetical protein